MSANRLKSLADLLQSGDIEELAREARERRELAAKVRDLLPAEEACHLVSADTDDSGRLILGMDSAAWAARVRYRTQEFAGRRLKVKVVPKLEE